MCSNMIETKVTYVRACFLYKNWILEFLEVSIGCFHTFKKYFNNVINPLWVSMIGWKGDLTIDRIIRNCDRFYTGTPFFFLEICRAHPFDQTKGCQNVYKSTFWKIEF